MDLLVANDQGGEGVKDSEVGILGRSMSVGGGVQRGLHVTRLFLSSLPLSSRFLLRMVKRTSVPLQFFLHTTPSFSQRKLGDESRGSIAICPFQLGPPTRRELPPDAHPLCSTQLEREEVYNNRLIASERLSQLSMVLPAR